MIIRYIDIEYNVLFTLSRTTHSSVLLLCVVRFNVNKTLVVLTLSLPLNCKPGSKPNNGIGKGKV